MKRKYVGFNIYECPHVPTQKGKYVGKTPIYRQAKTTCANAKKAGKNYFLKGVTSDGKEVLLL